MRALHIPTVLLICCLASSTASAQEIICQVTDLQAHYGHLYVQSDRNQDGADYTRADNFSLAVSESVNVLRWWGICDDFFATGDCDTPDNSTLSLYADSGSPSGPPMQTYAVGGNVNRTATGRILSDGPPGYRESVYDATLPPPGFSPGLGEYWIETANDTTGETCLWQWLTAARPDSSVVEGPSLNVIVSALRQK